MSHGKNSAVSPAKMIEWPISDDSSKVLLCAKKLMSAKKKRSKEEVTSTNRFDLLPHCHGYDFLLSLFRITHKDLLQGKIISFRPLKRNRFADSLRLQFQLNERSKKAHKSHHQTRWHFQIEKSKKVSVIGKWTRAASVWRCMAKFWKSAFNSRRVVSVLMLQKVARSKMKHCDAIASECFGL